MLYYPTDKMIEKLQKLHEILMGMENVVIAYSGGLDSSFLLRVANDVLGSKVVAVTANSLIHPRKEIQEAKIIAMRLGVRHKIIETRELSNPKFLSNSKDRCYWCKREMYGELVNSAGKDNDIIDAANFDDLNDFRPGLRAASELGVRSPLIEAMLTKEDIRNLSKDMGLETWNKPSLSCLATRFPYGMKITKDNIARVDKAEEFLRALGIIQVRVRHHDTIARIEVMDMDIRKLTGKDFREKIVRYFKELGYLYITIDFEGYRTGSMNKIIK